ncbi:thiamine pyrophosphate-dependent dehydrogenase E1 component subunit alpha [Rothia kristinae]|uniref:thiamine pyrophosphate-dependent dehydrogenase E1 component subunit alpha n=1 Tax=Rothia kristinae TaxID=37923 RepID=UPI0021A78906|nr:thiamine pyrophosphate-dependent dehydrogenase E1 component subunit alpha [Rothia kristinae]MCT2037601.1 thiamine pyrophosphate-dependent dehydrogenase E1 component subunit alpha [Rothia kristinae]
MVTSPEASAAHPGAVAGALPLVRILDQDGRRTADPRFDPYLRELSRQHLEEAYRQMLAVRRFDDEATALQRQGKLALWVPSKGQEAAQIGSGMAMRPTDYVFPSYREHALAMHRGVDLAQLLTIFRGVSGHGWIPQEHRFHLYSFVLASQIPHAVGYAMGQKLDGARDEATVLYFGDGSSTEGEAHESMVFAASYDAPVLFFVQNNRWAISVPFATQSRVPLAERAAGYGFEGIRVDGNDLLGVYAVTAYALEKIRRGQGPVLIEAETYRLGAHTTADDPTKYRTREEEQEWGAKDPLVRLERHLRAEGTPEEFFEQAEAQAREGARSIREAALAVPAPGLEEFFDRVYAEPNSLTAAEKAWFREYEAGFADAAADGEHEEER